VCAVGAASRLLAAVAAVVAVALLRHSAVIAGTGQHDPSLARYRDGWRVAGANPQRTSWVPENVPGKLQLEWYRPFEPFISHKVRLLHA
jgi:hypothetical protein